MILLERVLAFKGAIGARGVSEVGQVLVPVVAVREEPSADRVPIAILIGQRVDVDPGGATT